MNVRVASSPAADRIDDSLHCYPWRRGRDDDGSGTVAVPSDHYDQIGIVGSRDPHLLPIDNDGVTFLPNLRTHR